VLVDVDEIANNDLEALTRRASITDKEAHLRRIFVALNADDTEQDSDATGPPARQVAGREARSRPAEQPGTWPDNELAHCRQLAEEGDAASARRVAELLELTHQDTEAAVWWHRAADAGDPDAILYVQEFYTA
jgi:hypothetical protein